MSLASSPPWPRAAPRCLAVLLCLATLAACDTMEDQPKQKVYSPSVGPADVPAHTVEFDARPAATPAPAAPPVTEHLLERGRERYVIYCAPCHAETGDGHGMIVQRGFPAPPPFDREPGPPQRLYDVITDGYGTMLSFADRVQPADRWAIVAYVYALGRSQHATAADAPPAARGALQ